ncbi:diguanylate cyclase regulator RdcB family protein [Pseudomonas sp. SA3-5]|uniref:Diguanylate cyclase regulator RdcB family protein n=1 Tax=Pseudomonas aestuarii TaxID=3018340 RepID=A0ABT4XLI4_9PSED|nr:diguanylate cyclase regulator RdcB family protein [Pseudomonas aestuarii]MDA7089069.1 diguanylate cyclase regulator RdcB family protein [Pseudomonas aestuarii]
MNEMLPITKDSDICRVLTCLPEKFVVDFANGIDVARDHQRVQRANTGFGARLYDGFTGKGKRRQDEVNASLIDGMEASLTWLTELSGSLAQSNLAIARVNDRVNALKLDVARIANFSAITRQQLETLTTRLDEHLDTLGREAARIDFVQRVQLNLDQVFNKWRAGHYQSFSLSGRCYAALEELRWGAFGDYCRNTSATDRQRFMDDLANRAMAQLASDAGLSSKERMGTRDHWLIRPVGQHVLSDASDALAYMGDWSDRESVPFVFSVSQLPDDLPRELPRLSSAQRVAEAMVYEVLGDNSHA